MHDDGQRERLAELYLERYGAFARVATAITGDTGLGHDAVQDGFAKALLGIDGFRGQGSLEGWVWPIVLNAARNIARAERRPAAVANADPSASEAVESAETSDAELRSLIRGLPERQRLVLFLRFYADLDYQSIAAALDVSVGTVSATIHAAKDNLLSQLDEVER